METKCKVIDSNVESLSDELVQKIISSVVKGAVDFCYDKGLLDREHEEVFCVITVISDVPSDLFEPENLA